MHSSKLSKTRNTIGASTTTMAQVCGLSTTQEIVRPARPPGSAAKAHIAAFDTQF